LFKFIYIIVSYIFHFWRWLWRYMGEGIKCWNKPWSPVLLP